MQKRTVTASTLLITGVLQGIMAGYMLAHPVLVADLFYLFVLITVAVQGALHLVAALWQKVFGLVVRLGGKSASPASAGGLNKENTITVVGGVLHLLLAVGIYAYRTLFLSLFPIFFALYALLNATVNLMVAFQLHKNHTGGKTTHLISGGISLLFGVTFLLRPSMHIITLVTVIGIYFALYALISLGQALRMAASADVKTRVKRHLRMAPPPILTALIPKKVLGQFNARMETTPALANEDADAPVDLQVFIHATEEGLGVVGHIDVCFDGRIISYGSYDEASYKLKGFISEGVAFTTTQVEEYLHFSTTQMGKTLFAFGLRLLPAEREAVCKEISRILTEVTDWLCPAQRAEQAGTALDTCTDYASLLYQATHAHFYKFKQGSLKTYFGAYTNCVKLADRILGSAGGDILGINGIITPGAYYEYLNKEYSRKGSHVITKKIITNRL